MRCKRNAKSGGQKRMPLKRMNKSAQELGKLGGQATKNKYGRTHYQKLAKHMNEVIKEKNSLITKAVVHHPL